MLPDWTSTSLQMPSICFRVPWKSVTTMALTVFPSKGGKPHPASREVASARVRSMRRSGLSEPYLSMASK